MDCSFALGMELSSTAATNGTTSFVWEAVESNLELELGEDDDDEACGLHSYPAVPPSLHAPRNPTHSGSVDDARTYVAIKKGLEARA